MVRLVGKENSWGEGEPFKKGSPSPQTPHPFLNFLVATRELFFKKIRGAWGNVGKYCAAAHICNTKGPRSRRIPIVEARFYTNNTIISIS